jgi:hypothetical protein
MDLGIGQMFSRCQLSDHQIPLYTHLVKEQDESFDRTASHMAGEYVAYQKELTDEEIYEILWMHFPISDKEKNATMIAVMTHCIKTALRKAQEK